MRDLCVFFEVLVLKNVGSSTNQAEANFLFAGFTIGEILSADHNHLVSLAVIAMMNHFVDTRPTNNFTRAMASAAGRRSTVPCTFDRSGLQLIREFLLCGTTPSGAGSRDSQASGQSHGETPAELLAYVC